MLLKNLLPCPMPSANGWLIPGIVLEYYLELAFTQRIDAMIEWYDGFLRAYFRHAHAVSAFHQLLILRFITE